jgi:phage shock protein A
MRKILVWLVGEPAVIAVLSTWNWLMGIPIESGGKISLEAAQLSLQSMETAVFELTSSVAQITASYQKLQNKYADKQKELEMAHLHVQLVQRNGSEDVARFAMEKVIRLEGLLAVLKTQATQAEQTLNTHLTQLKRERQRLESYKLQMQELTDLADANEALTAIAKINGNIQGGLGSAGFEKAHTAIKDRNLKAHALLDLLDNPQARLADDLDQLALDDEISQRLHQLNASTHPSDSQN